MLSFLHSSLSTSSIITLALALTASAAPLSASPPGDDSLSSHSDDEHREIRAFARATLPNQLSVKHVPSRRDGRGPSMSTRRWQTRALPDAAMGPRDTDDSDDQGIQWIEDNAWGIASAFVRDTEWDNEWLVQMGFGTPAQFMDVVLDSGSAGGWLYSPACCYASNHSAFDPTASQTYTNKTSHSNTMPGDTRGASWSETYGSGSKTHGYLGSDTVTFGGPQTLHLENVTFALATHISGSSRASRKMSGLIGLMPGASLAGQGLTGWNTVSDAAVFHEALEHPFVSATLVKTDRVNGTAGGGRYTFGEIDWSAVDGNVTWTQVTSASFWGGLFQKLSVGNQEAMSDIQDKADGDQRFIIDTGSALNVLSDGAADAVNEGIFNSYKQGGNVANPWLIPCQTGLASYEAALPAKNKTQPFWITVDGISADKTTASKESVRNEFPTGNYSFAIPVEDFPFWPNEPVTTMAADEINNATTLTEGHPPNILEDRTLTQGIDMCVSAFQPGGTELGFTILGDAFIKNHVVVFDMGHPEQINGELYETGDGVPIFGARRMAIANRTDVAYV